MPTYIRGSSYNGAMSKDEETDASSMQQDTMLNDFKNALRIISTDLSCNKQQNNGDNGIIKDWILYGIMFLKCFFFGFPGSYPEFGEYVARDNYFNSSTNNAMNSTANFPIGTFSIEQATQPTVSQAFPQTDYFNPASVSQIMSKFRKKSNKLWISETRCAEIILFFCS